jgi:hypothetical protein
VVRHGRGDKAARLGGFRGSQFLAGLRDLAAEGIEPLRTFPETRLDKLTLRIAAGLRSRAEGGEDIRLSGGTGVRRRVRLGGRCDAEVPEAVGAAGVMLAQFVITAMLYLRFDPNVAGLQAEFAIDHATVQIETTGVPVLPLLW